MDFRVLEVKKKEKKKNVPGNIAQSKKIIGILGHATALFRSICCSLLTLSDPNKDLRPAFQYFDYDLEMSILHCTQFNFAPSGFNCMF